MMNMKRVGFLSLGLFLAACGGSGGSLDQAGASKAMGAAMTAAGTVQGQVMSQVMTLKSDTPSGGLVSGTQSSFTINGTVNSPAGGSVDVKGSGSRTTNSWKWDIDFTFKGWKDQAQQITLDGTLKLSYDLASLAPPNGTVKYVGDVSVTGAVSGTATYDLTIKYSGAGAYSMCGTVGGYSFSQGSGC